MIKTVASVKLPVNETLEIRKSRFSSENGGNGKRISIVTGIHGDELEGQYVCYEVARRIQENPEYLHGTVDIYPAMNPLGIDSITRGIPGFDLDMNRTFPGNAEGAMTEYLAKKIVEDLVGSDLCLDIHASNIYLTEMPQIRINELHKETLVPLAKIANVDFIWVHGASTVLESTLAYSLNSRNVPTLVVEMGSRDEAHNRVRNSVDGWNLLFDEAFRNLVRGSKRGEKNHYYRKIQMKSVI